MNTNNQTKEQISALADGELSGAQIDIALAALRNPEARAAWDAYHQVGDVLRSDDMAIKLSDDFSARLFARLDAEPTIIAPAVVSAPVVEPQPAAQTPSIFKRLAMPGVAVAAVVTAVVITAPQMMMVAKKDGAAGGNAPIVMVTSQPASASRPAASAAVLTAGASGQGEEVILRDPRIDEYLLAHQRFSPSVFGSAQYARSATFAIDTGK